MQKANEAACPVELGETFALPLQELDLPVGSNVREMDRSGLAELAESMARVGQLAPILVYWNGDRFSVAAGFRRALAMSNHRDQFGFVAILARRIDAEAADLMRLVENFERENPSTFETCRYLYELQRGLNGRRKTSAVQIAEAIGRSTHYVHNLIRFYRVLPEHVRKAWAADGDRRFTFRVLNDLSRLVDTGDDAALRSRLEEILAIKSAAKPGAGKRRMSRTRALKLLRRLESAGEARLLEDDRAQVVLTLLRAFNGVAEPSQADAIVDQLLADLDVSHG